jgi:hypothetical protein
MEHRYCYLSCQKKFDAHPGYHIVYGIGITQVMHPILLQFVPKIENIFSARFTAEK